MTDRNAEYFEFIFYLLDNELVEMRKLDTYRYPLKRERRGINHNEFFTIKAIPDRLFVGNEDRGHEIMKFDLEGNFLLKIRKDEELPNLDKLSKNSYAFRRMSKKPYKDSIIWHI